MDRAKIPLRSKLWRAGWLVTFFFTPFGTSLPGLLFLLPSAACFSWRRNGRRGAAAKATVLPDWTNRFLILFLLAASVSGLLSSRPLLALGLLFGFSIVLFIFYYGAQQLAGDFEPFVTRRCLPVLIIGGVAAYLVSLIRYYIDVRNDPYGRAMDIFCGCNGFATIIIIVCSLSLGYFIWRDNKLKYLLIPYLILTSITILATKSRGGWLGFTAILGCFTLFRRNLLVAIIIIILILLVIFSNFPMLKDRFMSIFDLKSNIARINIWQATIKMVKDYPIIGVGSGHFSFSYKKYIGPDFAPEAKEAAHAHNIFLQVAAEFGLVGLVLFSFVLAGILVMGFSLARTGNGLHQGLFAALIGVLVHQQFDLPILGMDIGGAFWVLAGLVTGLYRMKKLSAGCEDCDHVVYVRQREGASVERCPSEESRIMAGWDSVGRERATAGPAEPIARVGRNHYEDRSLEAEE